MSPSTPAAVKIPGMKATEPGRDASVRPVRSVTLETFHRDFKHLAIHVTSPMDPIDGPISMEHTELLVTSMSTLCANA